MKIMLRIFILILLPINIYADGLLGHVYKDTWHSAKERCKGGLLTPTNLTERSVIDLMKQKNFRTLWVDVTRQQFDELKWPDGSANTMQVQEDLSFTSPYKCGYVNTKSQKLSVSVTGCEESKPGFICHFIDSGQCHQDSAIYNGSCYQFMYGHQMCNWQVAYQQCRSKGGSLATLNSQSLIKYISDKAVGYHGYSLEWWIGLSKARYEDRSGNIPDIPLWYNKTEPNWKKKCVIMTKKGRQWYWKTAKCNKQHPFICSSVLDEKTTDKITAQDNKMRVVTIEVSRFLNVTAVSTTVDDKVTQTVLIAVASFAIFLIIIISLFGIYKAINYKKKCLLCGNRRSTPKYKGCPSNSEKL